MSGQIITKAMLALCLFVVPAGGWVLAADETPHAVQAFKRGLDAWKDGDWATAVSAWEGLLDREGDALPVRKRAILHHNLGVARLKLGDAQGAEGHLVKATALQPGIGKAEKLLTQARFQIQMASLRKVQRLKALPKVKSTGARTTGAKPPGPPDLMKPVAVAEVAEADSAPSSSPRAGKKSSPVRLKGWNFRRIGSTTSSAFGVSRASSPTAGAGRASVRSNVGSGAVDAVSGASR